MYSVSNDYLTAIVKNARAHRLTGAVGLIPFDGSDVIRDSFVVRNQICPATAIELGGVYIGELDLTFTEAYASSLNIRGSWRGVQIRASVGVEIGEDTFEDVPVGVYTVESATWVDTGLQIVAYDNMGKFDKALPMTQTSGKLYDFLVYSCEECDVALGMSGAEVEALTNGTELLGLYPGSAMQTFRDMLSQLATLACCFATMTRDGKLVLRQLPDADAEASEIKANMRYSTAFCDYESYYSGLEVENMRDDLDGTSSRYYNENIGGLMLSIGANPFLQYGTNEVVTRMRQAIIDALEGFRATPFDATILPNPAYDLGDSIEFPGGIGQGSLGVVMSLVYTVNKTVLEGYGENPTAAGVTSMIQKEVEAQARSRADEIVIHTYTNVDDYDLDNHSREPVVGIDFATVKPCIVTMQHEINLDLEVIDDLATVTAYYYLNDELQSYQPVGTFSEDGKHIIPLMYFLNTLEGGTAYEWRVELEVNGGSGTIDRGDVHAWLQGQGLVALDEFAGTIHVEDTYEPIILTREIASIVDTVSELTIADYNVKVETLQDLWNVAGLGEKDLATLHDQNVSVQFAYVVYALCSDDGNYALCDDTGNFVIINSDGGYT